MGARGKMGRGGVAERLANPAFKMASAANMADEGDLTHFHRPFHDASQPRKVICPENECVEKLLFFENSGLNQHFRIIHKKEAVANDLSKSTQIMKNLYGQETLKYISLLSEMKSKVRA